MVDYITKRIFILSIVAVSFFTLRGYAESAGTIDVTKISISKQFGSIKETYQSHTSSRQSPSIIFHIQDVHSNYEAQKNLANILEYLIETYGVDLILVEGGITDKDFSYIRDWASLEERKEKAEELLKEGIISGETYVDIASDFPLKFQGIEDKGLYEENMEIYLKVDTFRKEALKQVQEFRDIAERLKKFIYTNRLRQFDKYKMGYKSEEVELVEYLEYLTETASREDLLLTSFPNHAILLKTAHLEKGIDFDRVEKERDKLIERLNSLLSKNDLNRLVIKSLNFKEGKISEGEFYSYLRDLATQKKITMKRHKNLDRYIEYIKTFEELGSNELFEEINEIEDIISIALCKNDEQKELFKISKNLLVLESFMLLKLAPEDFDYYKKNKKDFNMKAWKDFFNYHSKRFHLKSTIPEDTSVVDNNFDTLKSFYETAFKRDRAFLKNSLKKMEKERRRLAVLIAGGFHTQNLTRLFMADNISYVVITPKLIQETDDRLYDRILKESYKTRNW